MPSERRRKGRGPQARTPEKRLAIEQVAAELFAEHGYDGVSLRDIAVQADVGLGTLFYFYREKQELYDAVVRAALSDFRAGLIASVEGVKPAPAAFSQLVKAIVSLHSSRTTHGQIIAREAVEGMKSRAAKLGTADFRALRETINPILEELSGVRLSQDAADRRTGYIINMVFAATRSAGVYSGKFELERTCSELESLLVRGLFSTSLASNAADNSGASAGQPPKKKSIRRAGLGRKHR